MRPVILAVLLLAATAAGAQTPPDLIQQLNRLAAGGSAEALYHLGMAYQTGSGVRVDHARAFTYFSQAAAGGDPLAAFKLGCLYDGQGSVVTPDPEKALRYDLVAARAGHALAQVDVAALYLRQGDPAEAARWLAMAAAQGWPDALRGMATLYSGQNGLPRDPAVMAAYFDLYLRTTTASSDQDKWLTTLRAGMSAEQRRTADMLIAGFRPHPPDLTIKGLSGQRAALVLVQQSPQKQTGPRR